MFAGNTIVVIEDNDDDYFYFEMAVKSHDSDINLIRCTDREDFDCYFENLYVDQKDTPLFFIIDLNLPGMTGLDIIEQLRSLNRLKQIPVLVFSASQNTADILSSYQLGANSYIQKPLQSSDFMDKVKDLLKYWTETVYLPKEMKS